MALTFIILPKDFAQTEMGVYHGYATSIIEDGDFNLVNQMYYGGEKFNVTTTYNHPDFHSNGTSVLWAPFVIYSEIINSIFSDNLLKSVPHEIKLEGGLQKIYWRATGSAEFIIDVGLVLSAVFYVFLGFLLCVKVSDQFKLNIHKWIFVGIFLSLSTLYYFLIETGNASLPLIFMSPLLLMLYSKVKEEGRLLDSFFLGIAIGVGFIIKVDFVFYTLLVGMPFLTQIKSNYKKGLKESFVAGLGFVLCTLPIFLNEYVKFDQIFFGYDHNLKANWDVFLDTLFSSYHGIVIYTPLFIVLLLLCIKQSFKILDHEMKEQFFAVVSLSVILKIIAFGLTISHGSGVFGARPFICDFFLFAYLVKKYFKTNSLKVILSFSSLWSIIACFYYSFPLVKTDFSIPWDVTYTDHLKYIMVNRSAFIDVLMMIFKKDLVEIVSKLLSFYPLIILLSAILYIISSLKINAKGISVFVCSFLVVYSGFSISNYIMSPRNVSELKKRDFFSNALIGKGTAYFMFYELYGSIEERINYVRATKGEDSSYYLGLLNVRKDLYNDAKDGIVYNPRGDNFITYFREFYGEPYFDPSLYVDQNKGP